MLASDGRCKTLDAGADGYVRSEGLGLLALRSVSSLDPPGGGDPADAASCGGSGRGVLITGSAVNQDGRSSGLTAPNGPSQQNLMRIALTNAHLPAHMVRAACCLSALTRLCGPSCLPPAKHYHFTTVADWVVTKA